LGRQPSVNEELRQKYLEYKTVRNWLDGVATTSEYTKRFYLADIIEYCTWAGKTPDQLIQERKAQLRSRDQDVKMTAENLLRQYANSGLKSANRMWRIIGSVKSFYKNNFFEITPAAVRAPKRPKVKDYRIPTTDDVRKMLEGSSLRDRAILLTLYQTGLRESSLVQLKIKHIKELFEGKSPVHIGLRSQELKGTYAGLEAHTFLGRDAADAIKRYLDWRKDIKGETITDESHLYTRLDAVGQPINEQAVIWVVKEACKRAGIQSFSPHDFRRATQTALESSGISGNWVRKIMGHALSGEENPYSQPKIEQLREAYVKAEPRLSVAAIPQANRLEMLKHKLKSLCDEEGTTIPDLIQELQKYEPELAMVRLSPSGKPVAYKFASEQDLRDYEQHFDAIDKLEEKQIEAYERALGAYERQQLKESLKQELIKELGLEKKKKTMTNGNGHYESKIVKEKELTQHLNEGWEFVANLNHEKYVVRRERRSVLNKTHPMWRR